MKSLILSRRLVVVLCIFLSFSTFKAVLAAPVLRFNHHILPRPPGNPHAVNLDRLALSSTSPSSSSSSSSPSNRRSNTAYVSALMLIPTIRLSVDDTHPPHQNHLKTSIRPQSTNHEPASAPPPMSSPTTKKEISPANSTPPATSANPSESTNSSDGENTPNTNSTSQLEAPNLNRLDMKNETNSPQLINALRAKNPIPGSAPNPAANAPARANHTSTNPQSNSTDTATALSTPPSNIPTKPRNDTTETAEEDRDETLVSEEEDDEDFDEDDEFLGAGSVTSIFSGPRSKRVHFMKGGYIEIIEWLFVFILVAPGTFPAMGCVLYTCTSVARRRINSPANPDASQLDSQALTNSDSRPYRTTPADLQRRSSNLEHSPRPSQVLF